MNPQGLKPGLYRIFWHEDNRPSLAAVGMDNMGHCWYAPTNWIGGLPCKDWGKVVSVEAITLPGEGSTAVDPAKSVLTVTAEVLSGGVLVMVCKLGEDLFGTIAMGEKTTCTLTQGYRSSEVTQEVFMLWLATVSCMGKS